MWYPIVISVLTAYFLGNLNGAVCVSALVAHDDVRTHGSGNAGLTNFIRNYGGAYALLVIAIDGGKAVLGCMVAGLLLTPYGYGQVGLLLGGTAVVLGHVFPAVLGFKGGKGILSGFFVALTVDWRVALLILGVFAVIYLLTRYVSLASVVAATAFSIGFAVLYWGNLPMQLGGVCIGAVAVFMHRSNLARLMKGQERKTDLFGKGKQK